MDELESRLRGLPLRKPSPGLDGRALASAPSGDAPAGRGARRPPGHVPRWSAAAAVVLAGLAGYGLGWMTAPAGDPRRIPLPIVRTEIIVRPAGGAMSFDFTDPCRSWLDGPLEAELVHVKGA